MSFYFGPKQTDKFNARINLRDINSRAKQWDHPIYGLLSFTVSFVKHGRDILKVPKREREIYCVSLVALALREDTKVDWLIHMPSEVETPDGFVATFPTEITGAKKGLIREIEVVEHRDSPEKLSERIRKKMTEKAYNPDTILVCHIMTTAIYNLRQLANELSTIHSTLEHVFVVFSGIIYTGDAPTKEQIQSTYSMVQLLPTYSETIFDVRPHLSDYEKKRQIGQEALIIEGDKIYYATSNRESLGQQ